MLLNIPGGGRLRLIVPDFIQAPDKESAQRLAGNQKCYGQSEINHKPENHHTKEKFAFADVGLIYRNDDLINHARNFGEDNESVEKKIDAKES